MAPRIIASATAAASWMHRRTSRSRSLRRRNGNNNNNNRGGMTSRCDEHDGSLITTNINDNDDGDTPEMMINVSDRSGGSSERDYNYSDVHHNSPSAAAAAAAEGQHDVSVIKNNNTTAITTKSRRRARSTIRKCEQTKMNTTATNTSRPTRTRAGAVMVMDPPPSSSSSFQNQQHDDYSYRHSESKASEPSLKQRGASANAASCFTTPPRRNHHHHNDNSNNGRSRRRHRSCSATKYHQHHLQPPPSCEEVSMVGVPMKEQSPQEKCPMAAPQPSVRYIRQGSNSIHSSCGSADVGCAGRQQQQQRIASPTNDVDDVECGALPLPTNNFYHPYRCNNGSNNNYREINNGSSASPPNKMAVDTSSLHHNNHRIRSTSMPHQSTKQQRRSTSLVRKQTYTDHDTTGEEEDGMVFSKKQMSFEQQLLRQQPLSSFEQQQQQQSLLREELSFEQQLLHQKPLSPQKQLSFEQQLLQQEPPPPFILPRSLSESLTPSHNDFPSSLSFEQQLLQQPEFNANQIGGIGVVGLQPRHQQYDKRSSTQGSGHSVHNEQSSFADATANCDGSSVIYFRNDSGEKRKRCTSLPPPLVRWDSSGGGSVLSGNSAISGDSRVGEEEGQVRMMSMSPPTTRLGAVVGGGSSSACPPPPPSRGVDGPASLQKRPSKQLSFEQQLLRQQPLSPQRQLSLFEDEPLSFEQQQPLPQKQLSFEQQLLQQEPPPPFILPRALSESLTPSHNDFPSSLSIEQQLHRQPELNANQIGEIGVVFQPLHHNYDKRSSTQGSGHSVHNEQSSFADATANCDGSSVIYFRNDSGGSGSRRKRCTSLPPPPMIRWDSSGGGSVLSGNSAISDGSRAGEEGQIRMMSMSPPTTRLGVVRHDAVFGSGGGPSPAYPHPPPLPRGVDAASLHRNNNSRSTSMPPRTRSHSLVRKTPYNAASADMPLPHPRFTSPQSPPPPMNYYPPSLPTPSLLPQQTELGVDTITPEEYQRLQQESEMVRVRMLEIEERIRDIELNRSNSQGGGVGSRSTASGSGVAAPASALGGGVIIGDDKRKVDDIDDINGGVESLIDFDESSYNSAGESEDTYYSDIEEEEEDDDEDTIGALLSSASLLNNSKYRSDGDEEEDADTVGPLLSSTSPTEQPWEEDNEEEETETGIEIQGNRISVSDLNLCESTSSFISINTEDDNDASAALTESNSEDGTGEPSTDTTTSRRKVRFDDDEQYPPSRHPAKYVNSSPPPTQAQVTHIDDHDMSRQSQDIKDRRGDNEEFVKHQWQSSGCGSVGSTGSVGSHGSNGKSGDSVTSTTSSASNSSGDYHTLKTLLAAPKRNRSRVCNHSTISEEDEYCGDCGDIVSSPTTQNALAVIPSTQKKTTTEPVQGNGVLSRHVEQLQNPLERKGTQNSTSSASSISTLLEHAPLEVHLTGLQKRRSKLLEMVEAQEQNSDDTKTQRSIEFSLFLMKDKLNQLQDLGVLGEEDEDEILKSGGTRRLLRKIKSEGANHSEGREVSSYKRSSTATAPDRHYP